MYQQKRIQFFLLLLTMLLLVGTQTVKADDNLPRIILPSLTTNGDDDGVIGSTSFITERQPYFTVYVWVRNEDHSDTYWKEAPTLYVDGHGVTLSDIHGDHGFNKSTDCYQYVCCDADSVYYIARTRPGFMAKNDDNKKFWLTYTNLANYSNCDQDWYIPVDIYISKNRNGAYHKIEVKGLMETDDGENKMTAKSYDDKEYFVETHVTKSPTELSTKLTHLQWSNPGKLTFTSTEMNEPSSGWGNYTINLEDVYSGTINFK